MSLLTVKGYSYSISPASPPVQETMTDTLDSKVSVDNNSAVFKIDVVLKGTDDYTGSASGTIAGSTQYVLGNDTSYVQEGDSVKINVPLIHTPSGALVPTTYTVKVEGANQDSTSVE